MHHKETLQEYLNDCKRQNPQQKGKKSSRAVSKAKGVGCHPASKQEEFASRYSSLSLRRVLTPLNSQSQGPATESLPKLNPSLSFRPPPSPDSPPNAFNTDEAASPDVKSLKSQSPVSKETPEGSEISLPGPLNQAKALETSPEQTPSPHIAAPSTFGGRSRRCQEDSSPLVNQTWSLISAFDKASIEDSPGSARTLGEGMSSSSKSKIFPWGRQTGISSPELPGTRKNAVPSPSKAWAKDKAISTPDVSELMHTSPATPVFFRQDLRGDPMSISPGPKTRSWNDFLQTGSREKSRLGIMQPISNTGVSPGPKEPHREDHSRLPGPAKKVIAKAKPALQMSQATKQFVESNAPIEFTPGDWLAELNDPPLQEAKSNLQTTHMTGSPKRQRQEAGQPKNSSPALLAGGSRGKENTCGQMQHAAKRDSVKPASSVKAQKTWWADRLTSLSQEKENGPAVKPAAVGTNRFYGAGAEDRVLRPQNSSQSSNQAFAWANPRDPSKALNAPGREKQPPNHAANQFRPPRECAYPAKQLSAVNQQPCGKFYRPFKKQLEALEFAANANNSLAAVHPDGNIPPEAVVKCWVEELPGKACFYRSFLAASAETFWSQYQHLAAHSRHCYEVIEQGKPSHLYWDLEYEKEFNADLDGNKMVDTLIQMAVKAIKEFWGLEVEAANIIEIDSTTDVKFSRHLVIKLPGYAFENNVAVGSFVHKLLERPEAAELTVRKNSGDDGVQTFTSMVDTGVYTKNRNFRLLWSSKGGKKAILRMTHRLSGDRSREDTLASQFMSSLVTLVDLNSKLLTLELSRVNVKGLIKEAGGWRDPTSKTGGSYAVGPDTLHLHKQDQGDIELGGMFSPEEVQAWAEAAKKFVEEAAMKLAGGLHAYVRSIVQCGSSGTVAYGMLGPGSHYCENIGRCHKSNHNFFVVNFLEGVFCQKCYDPDCSVYRSAWMPLPEELCHKQGRSSC